VMRSTAVLTSGRSIAGAPCCGRCRCSSHGR
jgi:hypothetical protein